MLPLFILPSPNLGKVGDAFHDFENVALFIRDDG